MKTILLLNDSMANGGAERAMANLANELVDRGRKVFLVSLEDSLGYELDARIAYSACRAKFLGVFHKFVALFIDSFRLYRFLKKNRIGIVLSYQNRSNITNILCKWVGSHHTAILSERIYTPHYYKEGIASFVLKTLVKITYNSADAIVCNAMDIANGLKRYFRILKPPLFVINNGYDFDRIKTLAATPLEKRLKDYFSENRVIITMGRLSKQKGQHYLIRAFSLLADKSDQKLVILGEGPLRNELQALVESLDLVNHVLFLGHQDNPYKFLARASLFVLPSVYEGYPNALAEASICGLPLIAFDFKSGARDILGDSEFGRLVKVGDVEGLANALESKVSFPLPPLESLQSMVDHFEHVIEST
jgi:N-acetylgalactosamine-N,N'-diacetylbacillosaminyl-diphospho-undecaprenol 4-alpha-N-acetylgalactosaminyltransferase